MSDQHTWQVSRIYWEPPVFLQLDFGVKIAIIGFLVSSCGFLVRSCWAELNYDKILAVGGRDSKLWLLKVQKKLHLQYFWYYNLSRMNKLCLFWSTNV